MATVRRNGAPETVDLSANLRGPALGPVVHPRLDDGALEEAITTDFIQLRYEAREVGPMERSRRQFVHLLLDPVKAQIGGEFVSLSVKARLYGHGVLVVEVSRSLGARSIEALRQELELSETPWEQMWLPASLAVGRAAPMGGALDEPAYKSHNQASTSQHAVEHLLPVLHPGSPIKESPDFWLVRVIMDSVRQHLTGSHRPGRWMMGRPTLYIAKFDDQPEDVAHLADVHRLALLSLGFRLPRPGGEELMRWQELGEASTVNLARTVTVFARRPGTSGTPGFYRANVREHFIARTLSRLRQVEEQAVSDLRSVQAVQEVHQDLQAAEAMASEHPVSLHLHRELEEIWRDLRVTDLVERTKQTLDLQLARLQEKRDAKNTVLGFGLTIAFGLAAIAPLASDIIIPVSYELFSLQLTYLQALALAAVLLVLFFSTLATWMSVARHHGSLRGGMRWHRRRGRNSR